MSVGRVFAIGLLAVSAAAAPVARQRVGASRTALATVIDGRGRPILAIDPDDFVVRETGQQREVLSVRVADYPIALVLDNSVAGAQDFAAVREAAARFVGRIGHRPIVLALTTPPQVAATLDDERATVLDRIGTARASGPGAGLLEAVAAAARALVENGSAFSVIVVISASPADGEPGAVLGPVVESGGAVHVIVNATFEGSGTTAEVLRNLADQTGGQFTQIYSQVSYGAALDRLADRLAPQLMVEYVVPVGSSSGNDVQLGVRIPGARVIGLGVK